MHQYNFRWGPAPHPTGELTALSRPLTVFKGHTSIRGGRGRGREGVGGKGEWREQEEKNSWLCH